MKKKWPRITYRVELADDKAFIPPGILKRILEEQRKAESDG